jgi:hypothetical protein
MCGRRIGYAVRDRSSDRRVYTSPVGYVVPPEVSIELERPSELGGDKTARLDTTRRQAEPEERTAADAESGPDRDLDEAGTARTRAPRTSLLHELGQGLLWAVLLSTLSAAAAYGVYLGLRRTTDAKEAATIGGKAASPAARPPSGPRSGPGVSGLNGLRSSPRAASPPAPGREARSQPGVPDLVIAVPATAAARGGSEVADAPVPRTVAPPPQTPAAPLSPAEAALRSDIDFVASEHSPQVRACYDRAYRHAGDKAPTGRIELSFALLDTGDAGKAVDIIIELNLLGDASVAACLAERIAEWRFPRPPPAVLGPPPRRLRYPFVFAAAPD